MNLHKLREELIWSDRLDEFLTTGQMERILIRCVTVRWPGAGGLLMAFCTFEPTAEEVVLLFVEVSTELRDHILAGKFTTREYPLYTKWLWPKGEKV